MGSGTIEAERPFALLALAVIVMATIVLSHVSAIAQEVNLRALPAAIVLEGRSSFTKPIIPEYRTAYIATVLDTHGNVLDDESVVWKVYDEAGESELDIASGVSVSGDGVVTVKDTVSVSGFTVRAVSASHSTIFGSLTVRLREQSVFADTVYKFDFGGSAPGYTAVGDREEYAADKGYGFVDVAGISVKTSEEADELRRTAIVGEHFEFRKDLPNGSYNVTVISENKTPLTVMAEGSVRFRGTAVGEKGTIEEAFEVEVADGQLNLVFFGDDAVVNALEISKIYRFDFGNGPQAPGYIAVSADTAYDATRGYGFNKPERMSNRVVPGVDDPLYGDSVRFEEAGRTSSNSFDVDLPAGRYRFSLATGAVSRASVHVDGIDAILNITGHNTREQFEMTVTDGQANITMTGKDGTAFELSSLEIKKIADGTRRKPTIYIGGDSTVCNYYPLEPDVTTNLTGWGQVLPYYLTNDYVVRNYATGGQTTQGFRDGGAFDSVLAQIQPGEYFIIQLGINDRGKYPISVFKANLEYFVDCIRAKNAVPILVTPQGRADGFSVDVNGNLRHGVSGWAPLYQEIRNVCIQKGVLLIDNANLSSEYFVSIGQAATTALYKDATHPNYAGAIELARLITEEIRRQGIKGIETTALKRNHSTDSTLKIYSPEYKDERGTVIRSLPPSGRVTVSVLARNMSSSSRTATLTAELHDWKGVLVRSSSSIFQIDGLDSKALETDVEIPSATDGHILEVYLQDGGEMIEFHFAGDKADSAREAIPEQAEVLKQGESIPMRFDFGTASVTEGYTKVTPEMIYDPEVGYGIDESSPVRSAVLNDTDAVNGDYIWADSYFKFKVNLPPGDYRVKAVFADSAMANVTVAVENVPTRRFRSEQFYDNRIVKGRAVSGPGSSTKVEFDVALIDGVLDVEFIGNLAGSVQYKAFVNALEITRLPSRAPAAKPTIFIAGDSTAANYSASDIQAGWGQMLGELVGSRFNVVNRAIGGRSTASFYREGRLDEILRTISPGDYLFIQMGHNDGSFNKEERYVSNSDYEMLYADYYIKGARQRGAIPVIITSVPMHGFESTATLGSYVASAKRVALQTGTAMIDAHYRALEYYNSLPGTQDEKQAVLDSYYILNKKGGNDFTHFTKKGAQKMAEIIFEGMKDAALL